MFFLFADAVCGSEDWAALADVDSHGMSGKPAIKAKVARRVGSGVDDVFSNGIA